MKTIRYASLFAGATVLAGCAGVDVERLNDTRAVGSPFTQRLASEYRDLANFEAVEMVDYRDADHFARKGLAAASGEAIGPDDLSFRELPDFSVNELAAARARLVSALGTGARESSPDNAAIAQVKFDCWLEQQEENIQPDHIGACRDEFFAAMAAIETPPVGASAVYFVFFDFDQSTITAAGQAIIDQVLAQYRADPNLQVEIVGHADRSGSDQYNLALSQRRAAAVANALNAAGIPAGAIIAEFRGERQPLVPTPDNVREPSNRRAEIRFL